MTIKLVVDEVEIKKILLFIFGRQSMASEDSFNKHRIKNPCPKITNTLPASLGSQNPQVDH